MHLSFAITGTLIIDIEKTFLFPQDCLIIIFFTIQGAIITIFKSEIPGFITGRQ